MQLEVEIIKTRTRNSLHCYAIRIRIGGKMEMAITEEDAGDFIKRFNLEITSTQPTDLKLNKKRFFDIKYS